MILVVEVVVVQGFIVPVVLGIGLGMLALRRKYRLSGGRLFAFLWVFVARYKYLDLWYELYWWAPELLVFERLITLDLRFPCNQRRKWFVYDALAVLMMIKATDTNFSMS